MSEITKAHVEWSVVHRLAEMLKDMHPKYNVTQAFGLLAPILCWVLQRVRSTDPKTQTVRETLQTVLIKSDPWKICESNFQKFDAGIIQSLEDLDALSFLIGLRNAIAHADERKVFPKNSTPDVEDRCYLGGFTFDCEYKRGSNLVWRGCVYLSEVDMRRIGLKLAEQFCTCVIPEKNDFERVASRILEGV
jgi:hypothetical protein